VCRRALTGNVLYKLRRDARAVQRGPEDGRQEVFDGAVGQTALLGPRDGRPHGRDDDHVVLAL
jgi:hypothetical protein